MLNQQVRKQVAEEEDVFLDDEAGTATTEAPATCKAKKTKKAKKQANAALLDMGINHDDE